MHLWFVQSLFKFNGGNNLQGYSRFIFIEDYKIDYIPPAFNGIVNADHIKYSDPDVNTWYSGYFVRKTEDLKNERVSTTSGPYSSFVFTGKLAYTNPVMTKVLDDKVRKRFILICLDRNGYAKIIGEPNNGLKFKYNEIPGGVEFTYYGDHATEPKYISGQIATYENVDEYNSEFVGITDTEYLSHFVANEVPTGVINGTNDTFTLAHLPIIGSQMLFKNGLQMAAGISNDYTISGSTITFTPDAIPEPGDTLSITYIYY